MDVYAVDAGWYGDSIGAEFDPKNPNWNPWYKNRGDWIPSTKYYPHGISVLGDALQADGLDFSLWLEPETSMADRKVVRDHPGWFLHRAPESGKSLLPWQDMHAVMLNLANPEARKYITALVSHTISEDHVTWYRQDFNIPAASYWNQADAPDRIGMTEIQHMSGLYAMWDELLASRPGLRIDNCASGGRRMDIEMMSRSFVFWRTDHGFSDTLAEQGQKRWHRGCLQQCS